MPRRIHLIEKLNLIQRIEGNIHESGYWEVSSQIAHDLVGGDIYFHRKQKEPSFFGGKILSYRIHEADDEYPRGRIIFRFEFSQKHRGVLAGDGGWSYEKKII
jgi:hypothetical protein